MSFTRLWKERVACAPYCRGVVRGVVREPPRHFGNWLDLVVSDESKSGTRNGGGAWEPDPPGTTIITAPAVLKSSSKEVATVTTFEMDIGLLDWHFGEAEAVCITQPVLSALGGAAARLSGPGLVRPTGYRSQGCSM